MKKSKAHKPTKAMAAALLAARKKRAVEVEIQEQAQRDSIALGIRIAAEEAAMRNQELSLEAEPIVESWWTRLWK